MDNNNPTNIRSTAFTNGNLPESALAGAHAQMTDVQTLRSRARHDIESGAITPAYSANREAITAERGIGDRTRLRDAL
jgi:hypothetical protein